VAAIAAIGDDAADQREGGSGVRRQPSRPRKTPTPEPVSVTISHACDRCIHVPMLEEGAEPQQPEVVVRATAIRVGLDWIRQRDSILCDIAA
jgi:hypothetical protein